MFNAPMSQDRAKYLIKSLGLEPGQSVIDFGCGEGAFLQLLASEVSIAGVGIDKDATLIEKARSKWNSMERESTLNFISADVNMYITDMAPVDAIICIGSEYIFGGYANLINMSRSLLKPKGKLLIGTIYWKQPPSPEYLSLLNGENPYHDLLTSVDIAYKSDYLPLDIGRANDEEWDKFESFTARKKYADTEIRDTIWQWQRGYLKWGIDTMGFCFLVLEKLDRSSDR